MSEPQRSPIGPGPRQKQAKRTLANARREAIRRSAERAAVDTNLHVAQGRVGYPSDELLNHLDLALECKNLGELRQQIQLLLDRVTTVRRDPAATGRSSEMSVVWLRPGLFQKQIQQICESKTLSRALYYVERLRKGFTSNKTSQYNDINLHRWQEYDDILTDSLWNLERRERGGQRTASYWGNFIPQIPRQLLLRYTKQGEWVLDPFLGSGTTLIESQALGRHGIGGELQPEVAQQTRQRLERSDNPEQVQSLVCLGDSRHQDWCSALAKASGGKRKQAQLLILHPPYHDIIRFSSHQSCLSNCGGLENFLEQFQQVCENALKALQPGRHVALIIGDKYSGSEWIPLGFQCMQVLQNLGCSLKSIVVKNFESTLAKRQTHELWRYRALVGGFYVFKHEYVFVLQKEGRRSRSGVDAAIPGDSPKKSKRDVKQ